MSGFRQLERPDIKQWLDGVEPAWTMLDRETFVALNHPQATIYGPIHLATDLTPAEIEQSPFARNALILLRAAATGPGLKLTATGNLSRAVVAEMLDRAEWPGFDRAEFLSVSKVINETDCFPLLFLRHLVVAAKSLRRYKGHLRITPTGRKLSREPDIHVLAAILFHLAFWRFDLGYMTGTLLSGWPQCDIGIVLWSLSVAAHDWQTPERLTRLCTIPVDELFSQPWDRGSSVMEARILRTLTWFGLLECRDAERQPGHVVTRQIYRKSALFDRLISFDLSPAVPRTSRH